MSSGFSGWNLNPISDLGCYYDPVDHLLYAFGGFSGPQLSILDPRPQTLDPKLSNLHYSLIYQTYTLDPIYTLDPKLSNRLDPECSNLDPCTLNSRP
eukprot:2010990-Rhodomonas_salina.2